MTSSAQTPTQVTNLGVAMFPVSDQDAAIAFYTRTIGWELRADVRFGPDAAHRWVEVAPPGSTARLALNPPMGGTPGGCAIGVEAGDVLAEHERLKALGGVDVDEQLMPGGPGVPTMFSFRDPDGNTVWVTDAP